MRAFLDSHFDVRVGASLLVDSTTEVTKIIHVLIKWLSLRVTRFSALCRVTRKILVLRLWMFSPSCPGLMFSPATVVSYVKGEHS